MKIISCVILFTYFSLSSALAGGTLQISGTVSGFDTNSVSVDDGKKIYKILKNKFSTQYSSDISKLRTGTKFSYAVPFDAFEDVRTKK